MAVVYENGRGVTACRLYTAGRRVSGEDQQVSALSMGTGEQVYTCDQPRYESQQGMKMKGLSRGRSGGRQRMSGSLSCFTLRGDDFTCALM